MTATDGRYKEIARAPLPGELPPEGPVVIGCLTAESEGKDEKPRRIHAKELHIRHGVVADPNPSLRGRKQQAAINIKTDALEREYANRRISDAAYASARTYRAVLERSRRPVSAGGIWNPTSRVDQVIQHEIAVLTRIEQAQTAVEMVRDTAPAIGMRGQRVLELVLIDELTLTEVARRMTGNDDRQAVIYYSQLFRDSCEALADHWVRRDKRMPRAS